jgi:hypothetical protein
MHQKGKMTQVPDQGSTNIRHHHKKFICLGVLGTGKCVPLVHIFFLTLIQWLKVHEI